MTERTPFAPRYQPDNCPHCEYDRLFPETADGGWVYVGNNSPIGPCIFCNPHGTFRPRVRRAHVLCRKCGETGLADGAYALRHGWPKCCGETMSLGAATEARSR